MGAIKIIDALSVRILARTLGRSGNAYVSHAPQCNWRASVHIAPGSGVLEQNRGSLLFWPVANRSIWGEPQIRNNRSVMEWWRDHSLESAWWRLRMGVLDSRAMYRQNGDASGKHPIVEQPGLLVKGGGYDHPSCLFR
jgi:hypothetical protein